MTEQSTGNRPTVVVIDDNRATLIAMEGLLSPLGYNIMLADNAEVGLSHALKADVALILADVQMPGIDGLEMVANLRARSGERKIPVVFISGFGYDSAQARRAYQLGALDYILKPIDSDILKGKIQALVTLHQQAREIVAKDRNIAVLGHDLRNPLAAIMIGLEALARSTSLSDGERRRLERMTGSAERMRNMIEDLLDYARTSAGDFPHRPVADTDFRSICETVVEELRTMHPTREIILEATGGLVGPWDPIRLQQAVSNLVGNALEHGVGAIRLRVQDRDSEVLLSVHNDGEPIPPEVLPDIFEPFQRGERTTKGLGLGLFIVREVVRRHGGTIDVESSPTRGTIISSRWPRLPTD